MDVFWAKRKLGAPSMRRTLGEVKGKGHCRENPQVGAFSCLSILGRGRMKK